MINKSILQHPHKINEQQVIEIRHLLKTTNLTQLEIAKIYNVARTEISRIKNKKRWKYLD